MKTIQPMTAELFQAIYTNDELCKQVANPVKCFDKNRQSKYLRTVSYPAEYIVTEEQAEEARIQVQKRKVEIIKESEGKLLFIGRGYHKAESNDVGNCRISTTIIAKDGNEYYLEFTRSCKGFIHCEFSISVETRNKKEELLNECFEQLQKYDAFSVEAAALHKRRNEIDSEYNEYNTFNLEKELYKRELEYTRENILNVVNSTFATNFKEFAIDNFILGPEDHKCDNREVKVLKTTFRNVTINIKAIAEGVLDMHHAHEDIKTVLAFGMLDAKIMEATEKTLTNKLNSLFDEFELMIVKYDITPFVKECIKYITNYVYKNSKMYV